MFAEPVTLTLSLAGLYAGHQLGDYWLQSDHQALTKGACGHEGRAACTGHVVSLTVAQLVMLGLVLGLTGTAVDPAALLIGVAINAITHWWADRRSTLRGLVLATEGLTGKLGFFDTGAGAPHMDQAWHLAWMVPAAAAIAAPLPLAAAIGITAAGLLALAHTLSLRARAAEAARS